MTDEHVFSDREHAAERYLLGEMNDADRERYEEHFFSCAECAEDVRTTAAFLDDVRSHVAPAGASGTRPAQSATVVAFDRARPRTLLSFFWPLPAGAAVAATLLVAVLGYQGMTLAGLKRSIAAEPGIEAVASYFLPASRGEGPKITVSPDQRRIRFRFSGAFDAFPFYRVEIRDSAERAVESAVLPAPAAGDELQIDVLTARLPSGTYTVLITGIESANATSSLEPARYQFTLQRQP